MSKNLNKVEKLFKPSSWSIDNPTIIYVVIAILLFKGISAYFELPREAFPEVKENKVYVSIPYPGNSAEDIERLLIDPLEDELTNISHVVQTNSTSQQDYGMIIVEFDETIQMLEAKQKVTDEVDAKKAGADWPTFNGAKVEPNVFELSLSEEMPVMNINITGDFPLETLKEYGEYLEDKIEQLPQIKDVAIRGIQEKEVEIAIDIYKMIASKVSFNDVIQSIGNGNMTVSAGNLISNGQHRTIRVIGEIDSPEDLKDFVVKSEGKSIYLSDIAQVNFRPKDRTSYARKFDKEVVMLDIKKRAGKNTIEASDKIRSIIKEAEQKVFPPSVEVSISNDLSTQTLNQVDDLVNNIIFGILLVVTVLMFFLGFRNALFVGFAIPMSMFMSFMIISLLGYTLNTMILFGMVMGLGMLVDNGIVVVENVYRLMDEGMSRVEAAKRGISEIAFPIIISTATTVAAFVPLGLWPGIMGNFMKYFPITLSVVLGSSLVVAIFMNSTLVSQFMDTAEKELSKERLYKISGVLGGSGILIFLLGGPIKGLGTLLVVTGLMFWVYKYLIKKSATRFQATYLVKFENFYEKQLKRALRGKNVYWYTGITFALLIAAFIGFGISVATQRTKIEFFPDNRPNQIITYIEYPQGTAIEKTNDITLEIEKEFYKVLLDPKYYDGDENFMVDSSVSQVGTGSGDPRSEMGSSAETPHRSKITASLREYKYRHGFDSEALRKDVQDALRDKFPGVEISVTKDAMGPPTGYPVNIELQGDDYDELIASAERMRNYINARNIPGIEELKINVNKNKPAMKVLVDRKKAGELGVKVGQVGMQIRQSLFGEKAGVYKEDGEDYDINVRFNEDLRYNSSALFNQNIIFRDTKGQIKEIPISALATKQNTAAFSAIKHKDGNRVVTVYSDLEPGYTDAAAIVAQIQHEMESFDQLSEDIKIDYTGQLEEQNKQMKFLMGAFFTGLGLIFLILIFQFSGISKPSIIMIAVFLSFIGVFGGIIITGRPFVIMMTMMGIISLAGIVVNNGVVLLDYTQILIDRYLLKNNLDAQTLLPLDTVKGIVVQAGKARLRPVILTAITTVLGLIPLAIGLNINFFSLFERFDPDIYIGGDNVMFWGPLAWTVIYGLIVATFLTLIIVPTLFYISYRIKYAMFKNRRLS